MKKTLGIVTELLKHMDLKKDPADATVSYLEIDEIRFIFKDGKYVGWYNYKTGPEKPKNSQGEKSSEPSKTVTEEMFSCGEHIVAGIKDSTGYWNLKIAFKTEFEKRGYEVLRFNPHETETSVIAEVIALNSHTKLMKTVSFEFYNMKLSDFSDIPIDIISNWIYIESIRKFFD